MSTIDPYPLPELICAWCNRVLREGQHPPSHTICPDCEDEYFPA